MLFDLRGSGRRRVIKVVYLTLALLLGGGLVLFGIGGDVSGGLVDAITERGGGDSGIQRFEEREASAERATRVNPQDPEAWATLARARYQLAGASENFDQATGQFNDAGKAQLREATQAWERYLALEPDPPDDSLASLMVQAYSTAGLNQPEQAVQAQEIITEARPTSATFANLAVLAYQAGQSRKGDLARREALDRAEKDERNILKSQLDQAKGQAAAQSAQGAVEGAGDAAGGAAESVTGE